jgi:NADH-quinone oxidoreductase subunit G
VVLGAELELDSAAGAGALNALQQADSVIVLSSFKSDAMLEYADAILPVSPFAETSGTFVNMEGRIQSFQAVARPKGDTRPAWKVLRALGSLLELEGFNQESSEDVRAEVLGGTPEFASGLDNGAAGSIDLTPNPAADAMKPVPLYGSDPLVRRAASLQKTPIAMEKA